ncbi:hypothetical protein ILUMI_00359, partial [Ignelater luminosus]
AHFMTKNTLEKITLKYSTSGHSCVQDAVHSVIERVLNKVEYYLPISLLRTLLKVSSKKLYKVIQMRNSDFLDYQSLANCYNYSQVPYTQLAALEIKRGFLNIGYKASHAKNEEFKTVDIKRATRTAQETSHMLFPDPDREYYKAVIPNLVESTA